jgi:predicted SAM-dependent methyltransferase
MINKIYVIADRLLPRTFKKFIAYFLDKNPHTHNLKCIKNYQKRNKEVLLLFGYDGVKKGYLTIGYRKHNDIILQNKNNFKLYFENNSIEEIAVDNFINQLVTEKQIISFFNACLRILKPKHKILIRFLDSDLLFKKYFEEREYFLDEKYWTTKKRFLFNDEIDVVNAILFDDFQTRKLLNQSNVTNFLINSNFKVIETKKDEGNFNTTIIAQKNVNKELFSKLALKLPTAKDISRDDIPIYLGNCDPLWILNNFKKINKNKIINRNFASVIGSFYFLNLIPYLKPKRLFLFDINEYQVRFAKLFVEMIKVSENFENFIENFFCRRYNKNIEIFLQSKFDKQIYNKIYELSSDKEIFEQSIHKIANAKYTIIEGEIPSLITPNNSMCQHITILNKELFKPGPEINVIYTREGLADHFDEIKKVLLNAKIKTVALESSDVYDVIKENGIIYVSNIGEEDWLYDKYMNQNIEEIELSAKKCNLTRSFVEQWINCYKGFHSFVDKITENFWIIDSAGNIFNSQQLLKYKSDAHPWLWQKIKPLIQGKSIELIHMDDGEWGFKEYLNTRNIDKYIENDAHKYYDIIIFHILLGNGIDIQTFIEALKIASTNCKRIIILEHDRDSINFGSYSRKNIMDIRNLLNIIRSVDSLEKSDIQITWAGASRIVNEELYGEKANYNRNFIITCTL